MASLLTAVQAMSVGGVDTGIRKTTGLPQPSHWPPENGYGPEQAGLRPTGQSDLSMGTWTHQGQGLLSQLKVL